MFSNQNSFTKKKTNFLSLSTVKLGVGLMLFTGIFFLHVFWHNQPGRNPGRLLKPSVCRWLLFKCYISPFLPMEGNSSIFQLVRNSKDLPSMYQLCLHLSSHLVF